MRARFPLALSGLLVGCGGDEPTQPLGSAQSVVEIRNLAFVPRNLSTDPGRTVRWVNRDGVDHQLGQGSGPVAGRIESDTLRAGSGEVVISFSAPGVYAYFCRIHSFMAGTIAVNEPPPPDTTTGGGGGY